MRKTKSQSQTQTNTEKEVQTMIEVARLHKLNGENNLKAFVDIKVGNAVLIKGLRVLSNKDGGLFVAMPAQQGTDGKYYPTVRALGNDAKNELQSTVLSAYNS